MSLNLNPKSAIQGSDNSKGAYVGSAIAGAVVGGAAGAVASKFKKTGAVEIADQVTIGGVKKILKTATSDQARTIQKGLKCFRKTISEAANLIKDYIAIESLSKEPVAIKEAKATAQKTMKKVVTDAKKVLGDNLISGTSPIKKYTVIGAGIGAATLLVLRAIKGMPENKAQEKA